MKVPDAVIGQRDRQHPSITSAIFSNSMSLSSLVPTVVLTQFSVLLLDPKSRISTPFSFRPSIRTLWSMGDLAIMKLESDGNGSC